MPIDYEIDPARNLLHSVFNGVVSPDDILAFYCEISRQEHFHESCRQLADFHGVESPEWTAADMKRVLEDDPFGPGARRAFVGPQDLVFALARMFSAYAATSGRGGEVGVFRTLREAEDWLGLEAGSASAPDLQGTGRSA